ncbi:MAG: hypothetical protein HKN23_00745 [Verrucomicrobiales bacterium]|nr:hypothetical protein [Verrucomicrobiales bacterium]
MFQPIPPFAAGELPPLFTLLAVMLTAVVVVSLLLLKVQRSLLVGYFLCGVLIANSGLLDFLGEGEDPQEAVNQMAEFGVMLLMFVLGMEFSVSELRFLRRFALVGGGWQMALCGIAAMAVAKIGGLSWPAAAIIGVALAMSSTAVSLKTFQDMELSGSPGARFALGVAIFQDLFIIAFLVFLPLLTTAQDAGSDHSILYELGMLLARGAAFVVLAVISARWIIPHVLQAVAHTRSRELFTLAVIGSCVGLALAGALLQLSLALGAFVAGLAVSESVFKHRIMADIMPIKDLFLTLFFVSVGLMINVPLALENWLAILVLTSVLLVGKAVVISGIALVLGQLNRTSLLAGFSLCSAGEFSLLVLQKAGTAGLWSPSLQQSLIASATISMGLVPWLMRLAEPLANRLDHVGWGRKTAPAESGKDLSLRQKVKEIENHAIICGYGPVGRALNRALLHAGVPTLIIELNAQTVQTLLNEGQPVLFADVTHEETWELTRLDNAVLVAFTFPDAAATGQGLRHVRELNPEICTMARTRFAADRARLEQLGANLVIHDEGEVAGAAVDQVLRMAVKGGEGK